MDYFFPFFTNKKGYDNFFVKCIPQNYQYSKFSIRRVKRDGIWYELDLSEYMEWVIYYGLNVENRNDLYCLVKRDMVLFDIGSNIGETLLNFAKLTGEKGKVYGFEPVPHTYGKCSNNIALNRFNNVSVSQIALSNKEETLFFQEPNNNNSGGVFMNKSNTPGSYKVEGITLDAYVERVGIKVLDLIKVDVEGFETNVLKGASETCKKFRPKLFVEVDDVNLKSQGSSADELIKLISSYGYRISKIDAAAAWDQPVYHYDIYAEPTPGN
ncbi:MAG: FkbM family methyltransferase [Bacteroidia bacterium]